MEDCDRDSFDPFSGEFSDGRLDTGELFRSESEVDDRDFVRNFVTFLSFSDSENSLELRLEFDILRV